MKHDFRVGDRVRVKDVPVMRSNHRWRTLIGKIRMIKRIDGDTITVYPADPTDCRLYVADVLEHFGPLDFSQRDEGGVV